MWPWANPLTNITIHSKIRTNIFSKFSKGTGRVLRQPLSTSMRLCLCRYVQNLRLAVGWKHWGCQSQKTRHKPCVRILFVSFNGCLSFGSITKLFWNTVSSCKNNANTQVVVILNLFQLMRILENSVVLTLCQLLGSLLCIAGWRHSFCLSC